MKERNLYKPGYYEVTEQAAAYAQRIMDLEAGYADTCQRFATILARKGDLEDALRAEREKSWGYAVRIVALEKALHEVLKWADPYSVPGGDGPIESWNRAQALLGTGNAEGEQP